MIHILLIFLIYYLFEKNISENFTFLPYPKRKWKKSTCNDYSNCYKSKSKEWKGWKRNPSKCLKNC